MGRNNNDDCIVGDMQLVCSNEGLETPVEDEKGGGSHHHRRHHRRKSSIVKQFSLLESTEEYNMSDDAVFCGPYAEERKGLDHSYHCFYRKERQWLHDSIIDSRLNDATVVSSSLCCVETTVMNYCHQWLIFTVGVHGAGKHHTIKQLVQHGRWNVLPFVLVDADEIRRLLPEYKTYVDKRPRKVDDLTKKECGYISEVLVLAGLKSGKNVIWDCALHDVDWHVTNCRLLREAFPTLQIAMIHVQAPLELIIQRVQVHSRITERSIPDEDIQTKLKEIEHSIQVLEPEVDYHCTIDNAEELQIRGDTWEGFASTFNQSVSLDSTSHISLDEIVSEEEKKEELHSSLRRISSKRKSFDVYVSTEDNHKSNHSNFYGQFACIREMIDYKYHCNYTYERQMFQDSVIADFLNMDNIDDALHPTSPKQPWIVFTAGAMGAGKSYTMRRLGDMGRFPLNSFVNVDPDEIRRHFPEFHVYVNQSAELAGKLTRKEAGFMSEILTLAALQTGRNVIVDGSLRDAVWYESHFQRLRKLFPTLRIAIIHVTAPREAVFRRAAERALETGRVVPKDVLEAALEQVPVSVKILAPMVDFFVELNNAPDAPDIELVTKDVTWTSFERIWRQQGKAV